MRRLQLKRSVLLTAVLGLTLVVSGCTIFGGGIEISFTPNPVKVCQDKTVKGTLTIRTKGVGTVHIESASAILLDADGEEVTSYDTVDKDITILAPMSFTKENVKLTDATYAELSKAEEIKLVVDGDFPATYVIELDKNC